MPRKIIPSELVENRAAFLAFLRARLGSDDEAEEVLQAAYVKGLKSRARPRDEGSVRAWFYTIVRNALTDHYRRKAARVGAEERAARQTKMSVRDEDRLEKAVCRCMHDIIPTMKPEYGEILRKVELDEEPLAKLASRMGLSRNNATVRLHRARKSLKASLLQTCGACAAHGCLDCSCRK
jgi:RNA polymerase sigma-70 factor (ECF subfamily)